MRDGHYEDMASALYARRVGVVCALVRRNDLSFGKSHVALRPDGDDEMLAADVFSTNVQDSIEAHTYARLGFDKQNQHSSAVGPVSSPLACLRNCTYELSLWVGRACLAGYRVLSGSQRGSPRCSAVH